MIPGRIGMSPGISTGKEQTQSHFNMVWGVKGSLGSEGVLSTALGVEFIQVLVTLL